MNDILLKKHGCWISGGIAFEKKIDALRYASSINSSYCFFYFHNHIWDSFDHSTIEDKSLEELYKTRAQMLRDKYSYLILSYSGGSDSHNILHTFLKNNIKLDEIIIRWNKKLIGSDIYVPNNQNIDARNSLSEWDLTIFPTIKWLNKNYPEIKITIEDTGKDLLNTNFNSVRFLEKEISKLNLARGTIASLGYTGINSDNRHYVENTGIIYGVEKPSVVFDNISNKLYTQFSDVSLEVIKNSSGNIPYDSIELFYWSPDFPELPIKQAHEVGKFFKENKQHLNLLTTLYPSVAGEVDKKLSDQGEIIKSILYSHSWDFKKFQAGKPNLFRTDWWWWFHEHNEFQQLTVNYNSAMNNLLEGIDVRFLNINQDTLYKCYKPTVSKLFFLMDL
jgi:hypothetical protein